MAILRAIVGGIAGLLIGYFVAAFASNIVMGWLGVSDFEGGRGMAAVFAFGPLGGLLGLIAGCGGHLWMSADPPGNMTLKIHLPRKVEAIATAPAGLVPPASAVRSIGRWFRH